MTEDKGDLFARRDALMAEARTLLATVDDYTRRVAAYETEIHETFAPWGEPEGGAWKYFGGPFWALIALGDIPSEYTGSQGDGHGDVRTSRPAAPHEGDDMTDTRAADHIRMAIADLVLDDLRTNGQLGCGDPDRRTVDVLYRLSWALLEIEHADEVETLQFVA